MNRLLQGALALMIAGLGVVSYKAWRYRSDARTWHERWLALHSDPAHRVRYRVENERLRNEGVVAGRVVFLGASITDQLDLAGAVQRGLAQQQAALVGAALAQSAEVLDLEKSPVEYIAS